MRTERCVARIGAVVMAVLAAGCARGSTDPDTWITFDTGADPGYDPGIDPGIEPIHDPLVDPGTDTGTDPGYDPGADPGYDPGCSETPCGLLPQCGCPAGEKCHVSLTVIPPARACTAAGTGDSSTLCTSEASCAPATQCLTLMGESASPESMCFDYCNSETECPGDASVCLQWFRDYTEPRVCSHGCNPITGAGCPSGTKCAIYTLSSTGQDLTDCGADAGYGTAGSTCSAEEDCGPGTFCAVEITTCIGYCTYPSGPECGFGETCNQFVDPTTGLPVTITFDGTSYGYCY